MAVLYLLSLAGVLLQQGSRRIFDYWELTFALLVPIICVVAGKMVYDYRVRKYGLTAGRARYYAFFFGVTVLLMAAFQTISTVLFSPGGPEELRGQITKIVITRDSHRFSRITRNNIEPLGAHLYLSFATALWNTVSSAPPYWRSAYPPEA